jgi:hypothetical protein
LQAWRQHCRELHDILDGLRVLVSQVVEVLWCWSLSLPGKNFIVDALIEELLDDRAAVGQDFVKLLPGAVETSEHIIGYLSPHLLNPSDIVFVDSMPSYRFDKPNKLKCFLADGVLLLEEHLAEHIG